MDYSTLKEIIVNLEETLEKINRGLDAYPRNNMGMVLDSAKDSSYIYLKTMYKAAFSELRRFNNIKVTKFKKEYAKERAEKYLK